MKRLFSPMMKMVPHEQRFFKKVITTTELATFKLRWQRMSVITSRLELEDLKRHTDDALNHLDPSLQSEPIVESLKGLLANYVSIYAWDARQMFDYLINWINGPEPKVSAAERIQANLILADAYLYLDATRAISVIQEKVLRSTEKLERHSQVTAYTTLGIAYTMQHNFVQARRVLNLAIELDSTCIAAQETLGRVCYLESQLVRAQDIFERTLREKQQRYGENNYRDIAHTLFELSVVYRLRGRFTDAYEMLSQVLERIKPTYKKPDLGIAHVLLELGRVASARMEFTLAHKYHQDSLVEAHGLLEEYRTFFLGKSMPEESENFAIIEQFIAWNNHELGTLAMVQWQTTNEEVHFESAKGHFEVALATQRKVYKRYKGSDDGDMDVAMNLLSLGQLWLNKNLECSERHINESIAMQHQLYGEHYMHANTAKTLCILGELQLKKREIVQARGHILHAIDIYKRIYENEQDHPDIVTASRLLEQAAFCYSSPTL